MSCVYEYNRSPSAESSTSLDDDFFSSGKEKKTAKRLPLGAHMSNRSFYYTFAGRKVEFDPEQHSKAAASVTHSRVCVFVCACVRVCVCVCVRVCVCVVLGARRTVGDQVAAQNGATSRVSYF